MRAATMSTKKAPKKPIGGRSTDRSRMPEANTIRDGNMHKPAEFCHLKLPTNTKSTHKKPMTHTGLILCPNPCPLG
jgi:hypothetical protein